MVSVFFFMIPGISLSSELSKKTVSSIWPYPEKILKVVAANADIQQDGQTYRMADVIAKSETTKVCQAYQVYFKASGDNWAFDSVDKQYEVSCKTFKETNGSTATSPTSTDPRDAVEKGVNETQRTVDDVNNTIETGRTIRSIFRP